MANYKFLHHVGASVICLGTSYFYKSAIPFDYVLLPVNSFVVVASLMRGWLLPFRHLTVEVLNLFGFSHI